MDLVSAYEKLYELTTEQAETIEEKNLDKLKNILDKKRELLEKIEDIDLKKYLLKQENPEDTLDRMKRVLRRTKELETENEENLRNKKEDLAEEMLEFNQKQKSRDGYQPGNKFEAKFIDKRS
ncbi:MAG: hypothetical protein ACLFUI_11190 [Halanaerobiales bacterium]